MESSDVPFEDNYIKKRFKAEIQTIYENFSLAIKDTANKLYPNQDIFKMNPPLQQINSAYDKAITNLDSMINALSLIFDQFLATDPNDRTVEFLQENGCRFQYQWNNIKELHNKLVAKANNYDVKPYLALEQKLQLVTAIIGNLEIPVIATNGNHHHNTLDGVKLPKITIPTFDGDYCKWTEFEALFNELIATKNISGVEKLMYLKQNIYGKAATMLSHLTLSEANFEVGWNILKNRYDNKRLIVSAIIERIFSIEVVKYESASIIQKLYDTVMENIRILSSLGISQTDLYGIILHQLVLKKLDNNSLQLYEQSLTNSREILTIEKLLEFLVIRFQALEAIGTQNKPKRNFSFRKPSVERTFSFRRPPMEKSTALLATSTKQKLPNRQKLCKCTDVHPIFKCPIFLKASIAERYNQIRPTKCCVNCFKTGHSSKECTGKPCETCSKKHNSLLHYERRQALFTSAIKNKDFEHVFLATAILNINDISGNNVKVRALLDSGSQVNMITEKIHRKLGIKAQHTSMIIEGVGTSETESTKRCLITLSSNHSSFTTDLEVFIVKTITTCQPAIEIDINKWDMKNDIQLADPNFNIPAKIDLIIGGELFYKLLTTGLINIGKNLPQLQNTVFGWVVTGKMMGLERNKAFVGIGIGHNQTLEQQVQQFWKMEDVSGPEVSLSPENQHCEQYFAETTTRNKDGRFVVKLQFLKEPWQQLGNSKEMAIRRFMNLEQRFKKDPQLHKEYSNFMSEYKNLGHMQQVHLQEIPSDNYFIPHHAVLNPGSSTTKFRVVFDASAKTTSKISLNEILAKGPTLQNDLFTIMLRFRKHKFVFSSDVSKMYRQILIHQDEQKWQLIVWREKPSDELKVYKLLTVTYGVTCASYQAIKSLQTLAEIERDNFPLASIITKRDFNVDDIMTGSDSLLEVTQMQQQLIEMLQKAGMSLHKWCANHPTLLVNIPKNKQEVSLDIQAEKPETKALGMKWIPKTDMFMLHYNHRAHQKITKRTVLSETAQLFDPLGLVNPVILLAKIFIQELWTMKIDWDDPIPVDLQIKWKNFRQELIKLNQVCVPRHMIAHNSINNQLHAFSDASIRAYGAALYIRSVSPEGNIVVNLACSKPRVAPTNTRTLPRLELCGAKLMVELAQKVMKNLDITFDIVYFWTDSQIVLSWINTATTYKTFVANRIASIKRQTELKDWKYIATENNPADLISRGVYPEKLIDSNIWWHGPQFLNNKAEFWPEDSANFLREPSEERIVKTALIATVAEHFIARINHHNSIDTLKRVVIYCMRFCNKSKKLSTEPTSANVTLEDSKDAEIEIIKFCQQKHFSTAIKLINNGQPEKTEFSSLSPFIDKAGIIRVGGRLEAANLPFEQKHPVLLPPNEIITRLFIEKIHCLNMHAGPQALLAYTRLQYWPINGKKLVQSIIKQCVICVRSKPKLMEQVMGDLPSDRVEASRPFFIVGTDFAGPIMIHQSAKGKRTTKAYICLFVCFTTKAVHIEAAANLTTEAFINCLKRFISRRGLPSKIFCDNAKNFVGAKNQLRELAELIQNPENKQIIEKFCWDHNISWHFIPPRSPHFGGIWESAIKSAKLHLIKILHNHNCTYDELSTALSEIEAILNSRPLTPLSTNPDDLQPLTAGHFLIGAPMRCINDGVFPSKTRWSKEYLCELQYRHKWQKNQENITIGAMVILKDSNMPPLHWKMASHQESS